MPPMHSAAPTSVLLKGVTATVIVLMIGASVLAFATMPAKPWRVALGVLPLMIVLIAAAFGVRGFALHGSVLLVARPLWVTRIELGALQSATADAASCARSLRLFGNGGLFVFCGWFRNAQLGRFRAFVTDWQAAVVIRGSRCTVVISPADAAGFVRALQPRRATQGRKGPARRHVL